MQEVYSLSVRPLSDPTAGGRIKLIGVGSPVAGDDLGWCFVEALAGEDLSGLWPGAEVECLTLDRPGSLLLQAWRDCDLAVLFDAAPELDEPWRELSSEELLRVQRPASSHGFGVAEAMALATRLGCLPADGVRVIGLSPDATAGAWLRAQRAEADQ